MLKKLFIGNLAFATTSESLQAAFSKFGNIVSAQVITDRETGRSRGFGFVEYETEQEAQNAINEMNGKDLDGRTISVNPAREPEKRTERPGGGNRFNR